MKRPLTVEELAEALYEGSPEVANLAEECARKYGTAGALSFYHMMGDDVQNFWRGIASQIIEHSREWKPNDGCCCILSRRERARLKTLPRIPETPAPAAPEVGDA
jgi:hypothetical protein